MNWAKEIRSTLARLNKSVEESVILEMAQHADDLLDAAASGGEPPDEAESRIRALVISWCEGTSGPRRLVRLPLLEPAPAGASLFTGLSLDLKQALRLLQRQAGGAGLS